MAITTKEELLAALDDLDTASAAELAQLDAAILEAEAAMETAGSEFDEQIEQAEQAVANGITEYNDNVQTATAAKDNAVAAATAAPVVDATAQIDAIGIVTAPLLVGTSQQDIQDAFDSLAQQLAQRVVEIKDALTALNNPTGTAKLKEAASHLAACASSMIQAGLPPAEDTQPEIDEQFAFVDGLR